MKILHICQSNSGGAGIAAARLNKAMVRIGADSHLLCLHKDIPDSCTTEFIPTLFSKVISRLPIRYKQNKYNKFIRNEESNYEAISFPEAVFDISKHPLVKSADIINLHWLGNMINYPQFFRNVKQPIVWTLHDMNPFLGVAHFQGDLQRNSKNIRFEQQVQRLKIKSYQQHNSISIVNLCEWMKSYSSSSEAFADRFHSTIFNSIDISTFKVYDKDKIRDIFDLPIGLPIIMFCSQSVDNPRKGFRILLESLRNIESECYFIIVGDSGEFESFEKSRMRIFRKVSDERLMALLYSAADLFVLPSLEDNLPNTMVESLSCGTPVISFSNGGMKDVIKDGVNGFISDRISAHDLALKINEALSDLSKFDRDLISIEAHNIFNPTRQAENYLSLYESIVKTKPQS